MAARDVEGNCYFDKTVATGGQKKEWPVKEYRCAVNWMRDCRRSCATIAQIAILPARLERALKRAPRQTRKRGPDQLSLDHNCGEV